eukprot:CAMPEP_0172502472 /NCGR_PEP_ID=MMETSP1066-20121228/160317_1 /TAXON_ID=671091 /ORGANISM="Coscinodiscus wailesii, Strain CCMP2513" /LENGTH=247 /DNA_ID=CAMNT_0013277733 /DNA_START=31 /DNA_END=774 /DNA_ORIENTATION=+
MPNTTCSRCFVTILSVLAFFIPEKTVAFNQIISRTTPFKHSSHRHPCHSDAHHDPPTATTNKPKATKPYQQTTTRRHILSLLPLAPTVLLLTSSSRPAHAKTGSIQTTQFASRGSPGGGNVKIGPSAAFDKLQRAKEQLIGARRVLGKDGVDAMRDYLAMNAEVNELGNCMLSILGSKLLSDEDKKAIGTIRTYGIAADVMIMYGGLLAEIDEMNEDSYNVGEINKYLARAMDSLDEVIAICKNSGF